MEPISLFEMTLRVIGAVCMGALVGVERERKNRPVGFRTMILISLGSCGFVLLGRESMIDAGVSTSGQAEISRVLQGLIGGIGFLGAGAVIQNKKMVRGLTTAAAVWCTAAVGGACGLGLFKIAALISGAMLFTLVVLERIEDRYFPAHIPGEWDPHRDDQNGNGNGHDHGMGPARLRGEHREGVEQFVDSR